MNSGDCRAEGPQGVSLRMPRTLHADLKNLANDEGVSMNALIVYLLSAQVKGYRGGSE